MTTTSEKPPEVMRVKWIEPWLRRLHQLCYRGGSYPVALSQLPKLSREDYLQGRQRCACCWELVSALWATDPPITCFFNDCGHVCCAECVFRWLFVCQSTRCPICVANEATIQLKRKLVKTSLPMLRHRQHWTLEHPNGYQKALPVKESVKTKRLQMLLTYEVVNSPEDLYLYLERLNCDFQICSVIRMQNSYDFHAEADVYHEMLDYFVELNQVACHVCGRNFSKEEGYKPKSAFDFEFIQKHLYKHKSALCEICFRNRALFFHQLDYFHPASVIHYHHRKEHIRCKLCKGTFRQDYFDSTTDLVEHCQRQHYQCYVCHSETEFYRTKDALWQHIRQAHFVCNRCPSQRDHIEAFATVADLVHHFMSPAHTEAEEMDNTEWFEELIRGKKNIFYYDDYPTRAKLDHLDSLMRQCYHKGKFNFDLPPLI